NHHLNASAGSASATVLEPDGNISTYRFLQQIGTGASRTWVYAKDVGSYGRFEAPVTCESCNGEFGCGPTICYLASGGAYTVYLPKGMIHRYSSGLLSQEQDANGNLTTYAFTTLVEQAGPYIASVTDPVGRVTTYGYEAYNRVCNTGNVRSRLF